MHNQVRFGSIKLHNLPVSNSPLCLSRRCISFHIWEMDKPVTTRVSVMTTEQTVWLIPAGQQEGSAPGGSGRNSGQGQGGDQVTRRRHWIAGAEGRTPSRSWQTGVPFAPSVLPSRRAECCFAGSQGLQGLLVVQAKHSKHQNPNPQTARAAEGWGAGFWNFLK